MNRWLSITPIAMLSIASLVHSQSTARRDSIVNIDASRSAVLPKTGYLHLGGKSPSGEDLELNSRYLTLDGKPWLPVMGEFHYSRYPPQYWEEEILKMKAGGINIIATYIFWIHHEEIEGQFDWSGQRDLRHFVELCQKHGMYVYLRVGPWDHGEARNGGFPDWLNTKPNLRTNDPAYISYVTRYFDEIGKQVHGFMWRDGGPIIGAQLENEYGLHGPGAGAEHILKLKQLAIAAGIDVPIYSVTGWPSLDFPPHEVIPVSGGYPDGFWYASRTNLPRSPTYLFNLNRELGDMGATSPSGDPTGRVDLSHDPYLSAEEAGGMNAAYHRRPLLTPDDIAALTLTGIGSGMNLYGYYMYHGGSHPAGKLTTLQESQASGYPNDLPTITYDFQAPLGEFGQVRESYRRTRLIHLFLNAFGSQLAPMDAAAAYPRPKDAADTKPVRATVRSAGQSGFLFVNNYVRQLSMPPRPNFQARIKLPNGSIAVPDHPIDVPAGSYFILPFNMPLDDVNLKYSTAQLLTKITSGKDTTYFFFAIPGISPEFVFDGLARPLLDPGSHGVVTRSASTTTIRNILPSRENQISFRNSSGNTTRIFLLTRDQAEQCAVLSINGEDHIALSPSDLFFDKTDLHLRSTNSSDLTVSIYPALLNAEGGEGFAVTRFPASKWTTYKFTRQPFNIRLNAAIARRAAEAPPASMGPYVEWRKTSVPEAPGEEAFTKAAQWKLTLPHLPMKGISDLWLNIDYAGDVGHLYLDGKLIDDNYYDGRVWQVGLKRFLPEASDRPLDLKILPIRADSPIYLDPSVRKRLGKQNQTVALHSVSLTPEYEAIITVAAPPP